jgi:hypothetical protein
MEGLGGGSRGKKQLILDVGSEFLAFGPAFQ